MHKYIRMNKSLSLSIKAELSYLKAIKLMIIKYISENNPNIIIGSNEKKEGNRRADVYYKIRNLSKKSPKNS